MNVLEGTPCVVGGGLRGLCSSLSRPKEAYVYLVHKVSESFPNDFYSRILADGQVACRDLERHQDVRQMLRSFRKRGLNPFEAYLAAIFSTKYFCPQYIQEALVDVGQSLVTAG